MIQTKKRLLQVLDALIEEGERVIQTKWTQSRDAGGGWARANPRTFVDSQVCARWRAGCGNIARLLGSHADPWKKLLTADGQGYSLAKQRLGCLEGIRSAVQNDLLVDVESFVMADVFDDLLEQAEHLFESGYVAAAGVLGRAVLEEQLRKLCEREECVPEKQRTTINDLKDALYKSKFIDKITMKQIDALAAIGNEAAHNPKSTSREEIERLLRGVREFLSR